MSALPQESTLGATRNSAVSPAPTASFSNLSLNNGPPPEYSNAAPPSLPSRKTPVAPSKPELTRASAMYRYDVPGDCSFEVGDQVAVYQYTNDDWWFGKNLRTGQEGVFPRNYVQSQQSPPPQLISPTPQGSYYGGNEKTNNGYGGGYHGQAQQSQGKSGSGQRSFFLIVSRGRELKSLQNRGSLWFKLSGYVIAPETFY
jgi:hypothetical protein